MSIPEKVRAAVLRRAATHVICECHDERVQVCEDCWTPHVPLEVHHLRYWTEPTMREPGGTPIDGHETVNDLAALCRRCHHARHVDLNGEFWRDPEEMADHWWYFMEHEAMD